VATSGAVTPSEAFEGQIEFETLLSDLSSRFVNLPPADLDSEIEDALRRVCEPLGIDLAVLWQWSDAPDVLVPTHAWCAVEGLRPSEPMRQDQYPWALSQMRAGSPVIFSSLADLPAEAAVDRETCAQLGIRSNVTLPLVLGGEAPVGALGFNTLRAEREWPDALVQRLQLVAQVLCNALARRRHELSLRESEERLSLAVDSAGAGLWTLDFAMGRFWVTEQARALFGYLPDDVIDLERLRTSVHPDDRPLVLGAIERSADGEPVNVEYRIVLPDGRLRWIVSRGRPHLDQSGRPDRLTGLSIDVTERQRAAEALRVNEARLQAAAGLVGLGHYEIDYASGSAYFDDRLTELVGVPLDQMEGLQKVEFFLARIHPDDRQWFLEKRSELHSGRIEQAFLEYRYAHPARGVVWHQHFAGVHGRDPSGRAILARGAVRDITARKEQEEELKKSYAEIQRLKDKLQAESDYLKSEINVVLAKDRLTGQSAGIKQVMRLVSQVAPTDSTVLIRGETGTGKELVAQAIHNTGARRQHVMVKVNCAALPSGLVESELFGREKGAFTGALARQVGRFEVADGSTIFLDEVGELPADVQVKLLRVLQEGEFERLGSPRTIKVNVRVIAATNRDLADEVRKGRFREDLYYRLNVFPIRVPPLRERAEDIPLLVWEFLGELSARMGKMLTQVPRATMEALQRYSWPGNVRELRNTIEHGAIISTGETLKLPALGDAAPTAVQPPPSTLADAEREHIVRALERADWHIKGPKGAAAALGLNPSTLYSRMKKLGISSQR
jgi:PAS domain S-box-containing protein